MLSTEFYLSRSQSLNQNFSFFQCFPLPFESLNMKCTNKMLSFQYDAYEES